jgi:uncharacterized membrane protein YfcA
LEISTDPTTLAVLSVVLFATLVRATFGFGDALVAMPLLVMIVGLKTATPLVALNACTIGLIILAGNYRAVRFGVAVRLIVSTFIGIPIGLTLLKGAHEGVMELVLAVVLLGFSLYQLTNHEGARLKSDRYSYLFGFVAGVLGGAYNTNGPPVVIYGSLRRWTPAEFRATLQGYFICTGLMIMAGHALAGLWTPKVGGLYAASLPIVFVSIWAGSHLHRRLHPEKFAKGVYLLLAAIATLLLVKTLL